MPTLPLGFILTLVVIALSMGESSWRLYTNAHSMIIVGGGTVAILVMSSPREALENLFHAIVDLLKGASRLGHFKEDFKELVQRRSVAKPSKNALINYATELWAQGVEDDLFVVLLSQRREELERRYIDAVQTLRNLAKYPPALGMTGTVMGLVSLFSVLGDDKAALGPALALAMTATFFGLILANCVVTPLADHLHVRHMQNESMFTATYQILLLINRGEAPALVEEEVKLRAA